MLCLAALGRNGVGGREIFTSIFCLVFCFSSHGVLEQAAVACLLPAAFLYLLPRWYVLLLAFVEPFFPAAVESTNLLFGLWLLFVFLVHITPLLEGSKGSH
ncbi:hypothetical protein QBC45DRAFT_2103 [Copromyces sp. CBS 386.78]|nr:hypothetical protein QBC45DRAFT_2103 [Copromyces sp. CBS 386.78]